MALRIGLEEYSSVCAASGVVAAVALFGGSYDQATQIFTPGEPWLNIFR